MPAPVPQNSSDDPALISTVITGASLCMDCIAKKTGIPLAQVEPVLVGIGETVKVMSDVAPCDACLTAKKVFRLA